MVPCPCPGRRSPRAAPRARGDGPRCLARLVSPSACSPRTRGWSLVAERLLLQAGLLPAHAGMVPLPRGHARHFEPAPRARGDGPCEPSVRRAADPAPRARGDGPRRGSGQWPRVICSPRTRGWSHPRRRAGGDRALLPAHAGMVPRRRGHIRGTLPAPRARGDGPLYRTAGGRWVLCSPRTRGWSPRLRPPAQRRPLLPAHAGMVPPPGRHP